MAENFSSILKTECIFRHKPTAFSETNKTLDSYIYFYNHERIQLKTGEAPLTLRLPLFFPRGAAFRLHPPRLPAPAAVRLPKLVLLYQKMYLAAAKLRLFVMNLAFFITIHIFLP